MATINTKPKSSLLTTLLIGAAGTIASYLVTMQVKKMLEAKGIDERTEDLKAALKKAGASASDLKQVAAQWISEKAAAAANSGADAAHAAADKVEQTAAAVKEQANG